MKTCISRLCGRSLEDEFDYCPYCGHDNRPPTRQWAIGQHPHQFPVGAHYCCVCGATKEGETERMTLLKRGQILCGIGAGLFVIAYLVSAVASAQDESGYRQFRAQLDAIRQRGEEPDEKTGPHFKYSPLGGLPLLFGIAGAACAAYGGILWVNNRPVQETEVF